MATPCHAYKMADTSSSSEDEEELVKLREATAGVEKVIKKEEPTIERTTESGTAAYLSHLMDNM